MYESALNCIRFVYTCPICGNDLENIMITTNPPISAVQCMNCGWRYENTPEYVPTVRVPFKVRTERELKYGN